MRRWEYHRTRSKVALLLLINLVTLLGGKYTALLTIFKGELFGDSTAFARVAKKKPLKHHLGRARLDGLPLPATQGGKAKVSYASDLKHGRSGRLHRVRPGETLFRIAASYGTSIETLRSVNRINLSHSLRVGERVHIPNDDALDTIQPDQALFLGVQRHLDRRAYVPLKAGDGFLWPVEGLLTSLFGTRENAMGGGSAEFHSAIDISVPSGTPVRAAQGGIIVFAGYNGAYGKAVKIDHLNGFSTLYAHNARILVHAGQMVKGAQVIALSGSTGRSSGPHLHFEVHKDGWPVDPLDYLH